MDPLTVCLSVVAVTAVLYALYQLREAPSGYPDGPLALPVIGNMLQMLLAGSVVNFIEENRKKYGNVFTVWIGGVPKVVVSGYPLLQDVFVRGANDSSQRPLSMFVGSVAEQAAQTPGLIFAPFPHWKTMRTFALNVLREEGMGKSCLEPQILEEVHEYVSAFLVPQEGKPFNVTESLTMATSNVISVLVFGHRFSYSDPNFKKLVLSVSSFAQANLKAAATYNIPLLKYLPGDLTGADEVTRAFANIKQNVVHFIEEHKAQLDDNHPRDYIDHHLIHMGKEKLTDSFYSEGNLVMTVMQLFAAGTETTSTALRWAFLHMCLRPDVQAKVQQEIDSVIGADRHPTMKDALMMPFTEAVWLETLRVANMVSLGVPRNLTDSMVIDGKLVPAGSELIMNMSSVMYDEKTFDDPYKFKPERFEGAGVSLKCRILPFGLGRRVCLGESLARMEFFLFFTSILQKYSIAVAERITPRGPSFIAIVHAPQPYKIIVTPRRVQ